MRPETAPVRVWDLPTRLFHWLLAVLVVVAWVTAGEQMNIHRYSGYGIIGLLVFRLYWGVFGSSTARFSGFVRGPGAVLTYVRNWRTAPLVAGHNPLGAFSVLLMLGLLIVQVGLGLFAIDVNGLESGPLAQHITYEAGRRASELHDLNFRFLQAAIVLHLLAIAAYLFGKRRNLITRMITGRDAAPGLQGELQPAPLWRLAVGVALAVLAAALVARAG